MSKSPRQFRRELEQLLPQAQFDSSGSSEVQAVVRDQVARLGPNGVCYTHVNSVPSEMRATSQKVTPYIARVGYNPAFARGYDSIFGNE